MARRPAASCGRPAWLRGGRAMIPFVRCIPRPGPMVRRLATLLIAVAILVPAPPGQAARAATPGPASYAARSDVRAFIEQMVDEHGFDRAALRRTFARARFQREIVAAMERPLLTPPKWYDYARSFLAPERVEMGVAYWNAHAG